MEEEHYLIREYYCNLLIDSFNRCLPSTLLCKRSPELDLEIRKLGTQTAFKFGNILMKYEAKEWKEWKNNENIST